MYRWTDLDERVVQGGRDGSSSDGITVGTGPSDVEWMRRGVREKSSDGGILGPSRGVVRQGEECNETRQHPDLGCQGEESPLSPFDRSVGDGCHRKDTSDVSGNGQEIGIECVEPVVTEIERKVLILSAYCLVA